MLLSTSDAFCLLNILKRKTCCHPVWMLTVLSSSWQILPFCPLHLMSINKKKAAFPVNLLHFIEDLFKYKIPSKD